MKNRNTLKNEISEFIKNNVFKNYNYENGIEIADLPILIMELCGYGFKITRMKTKGSNGESHEYRWQDYEPVFRRNWVVPVVDKISAINQSRTYITVSIKKSAFEKIVF